MYNIYFIIQRKRKNLLINNNNNRRDIHAPDVVSAIDTRTNSSLRYNTVKEAVTDYYTHYIYRDDLYRDESSQMTSAA